MTFASSGIAVLAMTTFRLDPNKLMLDDNKIRQLLNIQCASDDGIDILSLMGEKLFPAYIRILENRNSTPQEVVSILFRVKRTHIDRRMFILASLNKLVDPEPEIRMFALKLLGVIGTEQEIGPIIVMLSDEENEVSYAAAVALAAIGNERTVIAFDLWIKSPSNKAKVSKLKDMKQCREELRVRLDKEKAMKIKP